MNTPLQDPTVLQRPAIDGAAWIELMLLAPSPTNPRKTIDRAGVEELAASLAAHGQIAPILARPNPLYTGDNGRAPYEIVAGERRWRAAQIAGLPSLMTLVREMTDFDVLEVQVIENLQRADLSPIEEAEGYAALMRQPDGLQGYANADELAARIGKSRSYVYQRLKLCELCPEARVAMREGKLSTSVAVLIARMPSHVEQAEATAHIVRGFGGEPYSYRSAAEYLQRNFMLKLAAAPFDIAASYGVAGPCSACPKRSGANPSLFDDVTGGDMCQDRACFDAKAFAAREATLQAARDAGYTVLSGDEARAVLARDGAAPINHVYMDKPCPLLTDSKVPLRTLLGPDWKHTVVLDHPVTETAIELAPTDKARKVLKAKGLLRQEGPGTDAGSAPTARAKPVKPLTDEEARRKLQRAGRELFSGLLFKRLHDEMYCSEEELLPIEGLRIAVLAMESMTSAEGCSMVYDAHGWDRPAFSPGFGGGFTDDFRQRVAQADGLLLGRLLIELAVVEQITDYPAAHDGTEALSDAEQLAKVYGVDLEALRAEASAGAVDMVCGDEERRGANGAATLEVLQRITSVNLKATPETTPEAALAAAVTPPKRPVKYWCQQTGSTWSGRGLQPKWLKVALANGRTLKDFEVKPV